MENLDKFPYFFDEGLKLIAYCPLCDASITPQKAKIVESRDDLHLVHIQCQKCQGYILALMLKTAGGLSSIGLITDLNFNDVFKFKDGQKIEADEVLKIYQALNKKDIVKQILEDK